MSRAFILLALLPACTVATECGPGTTLNVTTDRCHISIEACGEGTVFDTVWGLCVARALPGHVVVRRSANPTAPKIATDAGSVVVSGSSVVLNTDSCPNAALDVCAIGQSIQTVQTNLDQASAMLVRTTTTAVQTLGDSINRTAQTLGESVNRTATALGITNSDIADLASLLAATQAALNVSRCERNPIDSCGFSKVCDGGPVQPHTRTCEDCGGFHNYGTGSDGDWTVNGPGEDSNYQGSSLQYSNRNPTDAPKAQLSRFFGAHRVNAPMATDRVLHTVNPGATNNGFLVPGDEVVVIHLRSKGYDPVNMEDMFDPANSFFGHYEFHRIARVFENPTRYELQTPITRHFFKVGAGWRDRQVVYMQKVPNFNNVDIRPGVTIYGGDHRSNEGSNWARTGMAFMRVKGTMSMAPRSKLTMKGNGFGRGMRSSSGHCYAGWTGEGPTICYNGNDNPIRNSRNQAGQVLQGGGGHGGDLNNSWCPNTPGSGRHHAPQGGGGGSHLTQGQRGNNMPQNSGSYGYGDDKFRTFFLGSGGGGASSYRHNSGSGYGGYGGDGAGSIMLFAQKLNVHPTARFDISGTDGASKRTHGGSGGGGSGGALSVQCGSECVISSVNIKANGGAPGQYYYAGARGGMGSKGRVRVANAGEKQICVNTASSDWTCADHADKAAYCSAM